MFFRNIMEKIINILTKLNINAINLKKNWKNEKKFYALLYGVYFHIILFVIAEKCLTDK
jgi:hypothetical protein